MKRAVHRFLGRLGFDLHRHQPDVWPEAQLAAPRRQLAALEILESHLRAA